MSENKAYESLVGGNGVAMLKRLYWGFLIVLIYPATLNLKCLSDRRKTKREKCPFCGGEAEERTHQPLGLEQVSTESKIPYVNIKLGKTKKTQTHYFCDGCRENYIHVTLEIESLVSNLRFDEKKRKYIADCISFYYDGGVTLRDLLLTYRTGIVRSYNPRISYISEKFAKRNLYICFEYKGVRTIATIQKEKSKSGIYYYTIKAIGVP